MEEQVLFRGKIFDIVQREFHYQNQTFIRQIVLHSGGVSILAIDDGKILLVSQTRIGVDQKLLEIPAGTLEEGEDPAECAMRELNEETGYACSKMEKVLSFYPTPGYCSEELWIYEASGIKKAEHRLSLDEGEDVQACWMDLKEAWKMVQNGQIKDGKTIIAIQHALLKEKH